MEKFKVTNVGREGVVIVNASVSGQKQLQLIKDKSVTLNAYEYKHYAKNLAKLGKFVKVEKAKAKKEDNTEESNGMAQAENGVVEQANPEEAPTAKKTRKKRTKKVTKKI